MRNRLAVAVVLAVLALLVPVTPSVGAGRSPVVLQEHFNDGAAAWTAANRYWNVVDGRYTLNGGYMPNACGRDGWSVTHAGDTAWDDYVLSARIWLQPSPWPEGELLFRVASAPSPYCMPMGYRLMVWGEYFPGEPRVHLMRYGPDGTLELADVRGALQTNIGSSSDAVQAMVEVRGDAIRVWIGDQQIISVTDPAPIPSGGVGLMGIWESTPSFDDVKVRLLR